MRSAAAIALAAATLAAAPLAVGCSASDEPADPASLTTTAVAARPRTTTAPPVTATTEAGQVISVTVSGGTVTPAPHPVDVQVGSTVVIEVTSDVADDVHVHGYDQSLRVLPGQPGRLELLVDTPGQFEVELESAHLLLFQLRVR